MSKKAIALMSGGADSTTMVALLKSQNFEIYGLIFDYKQRAILETTYAKKLATTYCTDYKVAEIDLRLFGGSSLTDDIDVPKFDQDKEPTESIPSTYVPARNTIFISYALAWAEVLGIHDIYYGANIVDYSNYPDCRSEYMKAFEKLANLATAAGIEGKAKFRIHAPLLKMTKSEIVLLGTSLGVDYSETLSCYDPSAEGKACGHCDSCITRLQGFAKAGLTDPARYLAEVK
jgi:7-cyano-7-deazaguanine synthase